jgi:hypothetical protein
MNPKKKQKIEVIGLLVGSDKINQIPTKSPITSIFCFFLGFI